MTTSNKALQTENELVEYKEKITDSLEKEAVAFLNAKGGDIYIGVKDNGDIVGIQDIDKTQLQVKDRLIFGISPSILSLVSLEHKDKSRGKSKVESNLESNLESNPESNLESSLESREISKEKILKLIMNNPKINTFAIANYMNYSISGVEKIIKQLKKEGEIIRRGSTKNGEWVINESRGKSKVEKEKSKVEKGKSRGIKAESKVEKGESKVEKEKSKVEKGKSRGIKVESKVEKEKSKVEKGKSRGIKEKSKVESKVEKEKSKVESKVEILKLIMNNPKINTFAIANHIEYSVSGVERIIKQLKEEGIISRRGSTKSGEWIVNKH